MEKEIYQSTFKNLLILHDEDGLEHNTSIFDKSLEITEYELILEYYTNKECENYSYLSGILQHFYTEANKKSRENPFFQITITFPSIFKTQFLDILEKENIDNVLLPEKRKESFASSKLRTEKLTILSFCKNNNYWAKADLNASSDEKSRLLALKSAAIGGTFDYLHSGHKLLLSCVGLLMKPQGNLLIGVTSAKLLESKKLRFLLSSFELRKHSVSSFFQYFNPELNLELVELTDPAGPTKDRDFEALIVTKETIKGGDYVNELRKSNGRQPLNVFVVDLIENVENKLEKISSSSIRELITARLNFQEEIYTFLKSAWLGACVGLTKGIGVEITLLDWFNRILFRYLEPWRHYHDCFHLFHMLQNLEGFKGEINNKNTMTLAIFFHDIIYFPKRHDNEKRSVIYLKQFLSDIGHASDKTLFDVISSTIINTEDHTLKSDDANKDREIFLDLDLAILGEGEERYRKYAQDIRKEYISVDFEIYCDKRASILRKFLMTERIYKTAHFYDRLEIKARSNLQNEIESLERKTIL